VLGARAQLFFSAAGVRVRYLRCSAMSKSTPPSRPPQRRPTTNSALPTPSSSSSAKRSHSRKRRRSRPSPPPPRRPFPAPTSPAPASSPAVTGPRRSHRAESPRSSSSSDSDFLLTPAERSHRRLLLRATSSALEPSSSPAASDLPSTAAIVSPTDPPPIPGYHFDPNRCRYFKIGVGHDFGRERRRERLQRVAKAEERSRHSTRRQKRVEAPLDCTEGDESRLYAEWALHTPSSSLFSTLFRRASQPLPRPLHEVALQSSLFCSFVPIPLSTTCRGSATPVIAWSLPVTGEQAMAFDPSTSHLLVCGGGEAVEDPSSVDRWNIGAATLLKVSEGRGKVAGTTAEDDDDGYEAFISQWVSRRPTHSRYTSCHVLPNPTATGSDSESDSPVLLLTTELGHSPLFPASVHLRHRPDFAPLATLDLSQASAFSSAPQSRFSSNLRVAVAHSRGLTVWQPEPDSVRRFPCGKSDQMTAMWHPSHEDALYAGGRNGCIRLFDVRRKGTPVAQHRVEVAGSGGVSVMKGVGQGKWGIVMAVGGELGLWDERYWGAGERSGKVVEYSEWRGELGCGTVAVTSDGRWLMAADNVGVVRVWEVSTGRLVKAMGGVEGCRGARELKRRREGVSELHHCVWMEEQQAVLVGNAGGVTCYSFQH
jgi:hypothetical protein